MARWENDAAPPVQITDNLNTLAQPAVPAPGERHLPDDACAGSHRAEHQRKRRSCRAVQDPGRHLHGIRRGAAGVSNRDARDVLTSRVFVNVAVATSCTVPGTVSVATVTVKLPLAMLFATSVALQATVVVPTGKAAPLAGRQVTATAPDTESLAVAV